VRYPYSGNANAVIQGIGVVPCVSGHPGLDQFWRIDSRSSAPDGDGNPQLEHVRERLIKGVSQTPLPVQAVRMDPWDATNDRMLTLEELQTVY